MREKPGAKDPGSAFLPHPTRSAGHLLPREKDGVYLVSFSQDATIPRMKTDAMRPLTISLSPQQLERIQKAVESGAYASNSEVLRDAAQALGAAGGDAGPRDSAAAPGA